MLLRRQNINSVSLSLWLCLRACMCFSKCLFGILARYLCHNSNCWRMMKATECVFISWWGCNIRYIAVYKFFWKHRKLRWNRYCIVWMGGSSSRGAVVLRGVCPICPFAFLTDCGVSRHHHLHRHQYSSPFESECLPFSWHFSCSWYFNKKITQRNGACLCVYVHVLCGERKR